MKALNELGLSTAQLTRVQEEIRHARTGVIQTVAIIGAMAGLLWGAVVWLGFDQEIKEHSRELMQAAMNDFARSALVDLTSEDGAAQMAEALAENPGPLAAALRGTIFVPATPVAITSTVRSSAPLGEHDFCALTTVGERAEVERLGRSCTCRIERLPGNDGWSLELAALPEGAAAGLLEFQNQCDCEATCFDYVGPGELPPE